MKRKAIPVLLLIGLISASGLAAQESQPKTDDDLRAAVDELSARYIQWLQSVSGLMTRAELEYFVALRADFRRDTFMEAFWEPRDPDPSTPQNELRERWEQLGGNVPLGDPRFMLYLLNGSPGGWTLPDGRPVARCFSKTQELEIWFYAASELTDRRFIVVFYRRAASVPYEIYLPGDAIRPIQRTGQLPVRDLQQLCADEVAGYAIREIRLINGYSQLLDLVSKPPLPSPEWLANFSASAADLPEGAPTFEVRADLAYPSRNQSRTAVQVMITVAREASPGRRFDGTLFHDFQLIGEVIRDDQIFESFRFRFEGPTPEEAGAVPLGFTRFLRPGPATLRVLLEDVYGESYAQVVREIDVPSPEGLPAIATGPAPERPTGPTVRLSAPPGDIHTGRIRFRATAFGEFDKVTFYLDGKPQLSKRRPPFSVELDLGKNPEPHKVRAVAFAGEREVATDQIWLNQGAQRFRVRLIEPRPGGIYPGALTARAEVLTPDGAPPERLELFLNDVLVDTLDTPPFARSVRLQGSEVAVIRAVAHLADGSWTEDAVLVNASSFIDTVEVQLVEVPIVVTGKDGKPRRGLSREAFRVLENGVVQTLERFEETADAPIQAALLVDRSISMKPHLGQVADAAFAFAEAAVTGPEDRVAVFSFADQLVVDADFTAETPQVERALAGLVALGGTALHDSLIQALNSFDGDARQTALLLFSDGQDESSRLTFEQVLETARRARVTLYTIGLTATYPDKKTRRGLEQLAEETGGRAYFLDSLDELTGAYADVLEELRSRYLVAYQSPGAGGDFQEIKVEVDADGVDVRARRGYYP